MMIPWYHPFGVSREGDTIGICPVACAVPPFCHEIAVGSILLIERENGRRGQTRGYMELVAYKVAGFICLKTGLFRLSVGLRNTIIRIDRKG